MLKARLRPSLAEPRSAKNNSAKRVASAATVLKIRIEAFCGKLFGPEGEEKENFSSAREAVERVHGARERNMIWYKDCTDVSVFQFREGAFEKGKLLVEECYMLPSWARDAQRCAAGECDETLTLS